MQSHQLEQNRIDVEKTKLQILKLQKIKCKLFVKIYLIVLKALKYYDQIGRLVVL